MLRHKFEEYNLCEGWSCAGNLSSQAHSLVSYVGDVSIISGVIVPTNVYKARLQSKALLRCLLLSIEKLISIIYLIS